MTRTVFPNSAHEMLTANTYRCKQKQMAAWVTPRPTQLSVSVELKNRVDGNDPQMFRGKRRRPSSN